MGNETSLWIGKELLPGYCLRQLRGRGGFGSVWEAETSEGKTIALKFLPCRDSSAAAKEIRSIQMVCQLHHPNLIRIDQVWGHRGYVVVTMELAEGSLLDLLDAHHLEFGNPISAEQVCPLLTQAAQGLDFLNAHQHLVNGQRIGLQHCDVKPSNLLLFGEKVKLCDFGLSSTTSSPMKFHRRAGTLAYAAPEVFRGQLTDWTDQYSLAVSYCQLRCGKLPFVETPEKFDSGYVRSEPDLNMLGPKERPIIARGLSRTPPDRWPSCKEMMDQLSKLLPPVSRRPA